MKLSDALTDVDKPLHRSKAINEILYGFIFEDSQINVGLTIILCISEKQTISSVLDIFSPNSSSISTGLSSFSKDKLRIEFFLSLIHISEPTRP